ncbi:hypothetical protein BCR34DRAFT_244198 [Clohesyomyces aquaticus]|uniref:Uncharacterized protein n=1 Tax=Clohesyomyces aquaticus TaxID=1231657 RepID=A0A1Y1ZUX8_9PLEO|nr:hypothetical protein BCR34DRAFT_244198 [Clohesyomyces aquaticus]
MSEAEEHAHWLLPSKVASTPTEACIARECGLVAISPHFSRQPSHLSFINLEYRVPFLRRSSAPTFLLTGHRDQKNSYSPTGPFPNLSVTAMEGLAAFSLACNVMQAIQFGLETVAVCVRICEGKSPAADGRTILS